MLPLTCFGILWLGADILNRAHAESSRLRSANDSCSLALAAHWRASRNASDASQYSAEMSQAMAKLATLSYCNSIPGFGNSPLNACAGTCQRAGFQVSRDAALGFGQAFGDTGYVARFDRLANDSLLPSSGCVMVFRGSSMANRTVDAKSRLVPWRSKSCPDCMVFDTFNDVWQSLRSVAIDSLNSVGCGNGSSLLITGHSNGAAVATLAMFELQEEGYDVPLTYNFESPRVGNEAFATAFDGLFERPVSLFRITQANDVIPTLPSSEEGFASVGVQVWYPNRTSLEDFVVCAAGDLACGVGGLTAGCMEEPSVHGPHCQGALAPPSERGFCLEGMVNESVTSTINGMFLANEACINWLMKEDISPMMSGVPTAPPDAKEQLAGMLKKLENFSEQEGANSSHLQESEQGLANLSPPSLASDKNDSEQVFADMGIDMTDTEKAVRDEAGDTAAPSCFRENVTYVPLYHGHWPTSMPGHAGTNESNASECQARCRAIEDCAFFSFYMTSGTCQVSNESSSQVGSIGCVAGPAVCATIEQSFSAQPIALNDGQSSRIREFTAPWTVVMLLGSGIVVFASFGSRLLWRQGLRTWQSADALELETLVDRIDFANL